MQTNKRTVEALTANEATKRGASGGIAKWFRGSPFMISRRYSKPRERCVLRSTWAANAFPRLGKSRTAPLWPRNQWGD